MGATIKTYRETIIAELAEAISSFNISEVAGLLSDDGKFSFRIRIMKFKFQTRMHSSPG